MRKTFGCVRFVYNKMLAERQEAYEKHKDNTDQLKKQKPLRERRNSQTEESTTPTKKVLKEVVKAE